MIFIKKTHIKRHPLVKKQFFLANPKKQAQKIVFVMLFVFILIRGGYYFYRQAMISPYFKISKLEIKGNRVLLKSDVKQLIGQVFGKNIFQANLKLVLDQLSSNPWIESATVRRKFPDCLLIKTKERIPFAKVVASTGEMFLADRKVFLIKKIEKQEYQTLPLIYIKNNLDYQIGSALQAQEIKNGINFIEIMHRLEKSDPIKDFSSITIDETGRLILNTPFANILFSPRRLKNNLEKLAIASRIIQTERLKVKSIDLTFNDQVILKLL